MRGRDRAIRTFAALIALTPAAATAQQKCFFLECSRGDHATPLAKPRSLDPEASSGSARPAQALRPSAPSEICQIVAGGHTYCASSILTPQFGFNYRPVNLTDNRLDTAWVEGVPGDGQGEWLVAIPAAGATIRGFEILNGYHKNNDLFRKNNRVRDLEVVLSNGHRQIITLLDQAGPQRFTLPSATRLDWIQFRIQSVYSGSKYRDTAITELHLLTD